MKTIAFVLIASFFSLNAVAQGVDEAGKIQETFQQYNQALIEKDGEKAASFITNSTFQNYEQNRTLALRGSKEEILQRSFADQMQILIMRHKIDKKVLEQLSGKSLFIYTINDGWVEKKGIKVQKLGNIQLDNKQAHAKLLFSKKDWGAELLFIKEMDIWKIDLNSMTLFVSNGLEYAKSFKPSQKHDDFLKKLVELAVSRHLKDQLWELP